MGGLPLALGTGLPGLGGTEVVLEVADSAGRPGAAEAAMTRLRDAQAVGVVVADSPEVVAAAGQWADRRQVPLVDATTTAVFLPEVGLEWYFRTTPSDRMLVEAVLAMFDRAGTGRRLTVLTAPSGAGSDLVTLLRELSAASGFTATTATGSDPDDRAPGGSAADAVVAVAVTPAESRALAGVLGDTGPPVAAAGIGAGFDAGPGPDRPAAAVPHPTAWSPDIAARQPLARAVADLYRQRYGEVMTVPAASAFTATMTLARAVDGSGATDPTAVRASLRQLSIPATEIIMPWHGIEFGADGQNVRAAAVVEQWVGGRAVVVYPPEIATAPVVWPSSDPGGGP